jgi:hypothetical protein
LGRSGRRKTKRGGRLEEGMRESQSAEREDGDERSRNLSLSLPVSSLSLSFLEQGGRETAQLFFPFYY